MSLTVLLVEDEIDLMLAFRILLEAAGYNVVEAPTGEDALAMLDTITPDAIVLDIMLPGIDGWTVLDTLRRAGKAPDVPIIVTSANATPEQERRAKEFGCAGFFTKPFDAEEFCRDIERLVS